MPRHSRRCYFVTLFLFLFLFPFRSNKICPPPFAGNPVLVSSVASSQPRPVNVVSARASGRRATRALRSRPGTETAIVKLASTHNAGVAASGVAHPRPPSSNFGVWFVPRQARIDSVIRPAARGRLPTFVEIHANSRAYDAWHRDAFSHAPLA